MAWDAGAPGWMSYDEGGAGTDFDIQTGNPTDTYADTYADNQNGAGLFLLSAADFTWDPDTY